MNSRNEQATSDEENARLWRLVDIGFDELDALPFGAVVVDASGKILAYNQYEARLAHNDRDAVIGKNFFRDVAPCTAVQAFQGRLQAFIAGEARASTRFNYFFPFSHGPIDVTITFLKLRGRDQVLIAVERVELASAEPAE